MPKIVIGVGIAGHPIAAAGNSWAFLQWVLGFKDLGWEVLAVEALAEEKLIGPDWQPTAAGASANESHWRHTLQRFGLEGQAALFISGQSPAAAQARAFAREADVFLNISGHFPRDLLDMPQSRKVYLDLDPGFTQVWAEGYGVDMNWDGHEVFFSVGTRLGQADCLAPTGGKTWLPTLPPVVLTHWPAQPLSAGSPFTTVAHWQGYRWCEWQDRWLTGKSEEFNRLVDLPQRCDVPLEIATDVSAHAEELRPFQQSGWRLADAAEVCRSYDSYAAYLGASAGELSAAKGGYVTTRCGWLSDRTACYLALGRPAVVQRTTAHPAVPVGTGLLDFSTPEEAAEACRRVAADHTAHGRAARRLAEEHFSSRVVIPRMLDRL